MNTSPLVQCRKSSAFCYSFRVQGFACLSSHPIDWCCCFLLQPDLNGKHGGPTKEEAKKLQKFVNTLWANTPQSDIIIPAGIINDDSYGGSSSSSSHNDTFVTVQEGQPLVDVMYIDVNYPLESAGTSSGEQYDLDPAASTSALACVCKRQLLHVSTCVSVLAYITMPWNIWDQVC